MSMDAGKTTAGSTGKMLPASQAGKGKVRTGYNDSTNTAGETNGFGGGRVGDVLGNAKKYPMTERGKNKLSDASNGKRSPEGFDGGLIDGKV